MNHLSSKLNIIEDGVNIKLKEIQEGEAELAKISVYKEDFEKSVSLFDVKLEEIDKKSKIVKQTDQKINDLEM